MSEYERGVREERARVLAFLREALTNDAAAWLAARIDCGEHAAESGAEDGPEKAGASTDEERFVHAAKAALLFALENVEHYSACDFCDCGKSDDHGDYIPHRSDCPLFGFDKTVDFDRLKDWAIEPAPKAKRPAIGWRVYQADGEYVGLYGERPRIIRVVAREKGRGA